MDIPRLRHMNCEATGCQQCRADHFDLELHLLQAGVCGPTLQLYRTWLDAHGIPAETAHGWATQEAFDPRNIAQFIEEETIE